MSRRAVILAGGLGARLRPFTTVLPKPLMPVGEYPIMEIIIRQLVQCGIHEITIALNHKAHLIQAFFTDGSRWNAHITYSLEDRPLGTMGPLRLIPDLPDDFLVMNGDVLTDFDYRAFYDHHANSNNLFTVACCQREQKSEFGVLEIDNNRLIGFTEKPIAKYMVSMGIYMANKCVLEYIPENTFYGFDLLMLQLLHSKIQANIYHHSGLWLDIGRSEDYADANEKFELMKEAILL